MDGPTTVSTVSPEKPLKRLRAFLVAFFTSLKRGANQIMNWHRNKTLGHNRKFCRSSCTGFVTGCYPD